MLVCSMAEWGVCGVVVGSWLNHFIDSHASLCFLSFFPVGPEEETQTWKFPAGPERHKHGKRYSSTLSLCACIMCSTYV